MQKKRMAHLRSDRKLYLLLGRADRQIRLASSFMQRDRALRFAFLRFRVKWVVRFRWWRRRRRDKWVIGAPLVTIKTQKTLNRPVKSV